MLRTSRWSALALMGLAGGCVATPNGIGGEQVPAANAAIDAAIAGGVAAKRRSDGDCYTPCTPGNACNPKTGYCEPLPCGGACPAGQACNAGALIPHCEASDALMVRKQGDPIQAPPSDGPLAP